VEVQPHPSEHVGHGSGGQDVGAVDVVVVTGTHAHVPHVPVTGGMIVKDHPAVQVGHGRGGQEAVGHG
jgi:hypothetical protein